MTPLDVDLAAMLGSYVSLPLWISEAGTFAVTISIGPIPDDSTSVVASVQRSTGGPWEDVGGLSCSGSGSDGVATSTYSTNGGEKYRLYVLVTGSPTPVSSRGS